MQNLDSVAQADSAIGAAELSMNYVLTRAEVGANGTSYHYDNVYRVTLKMDGGAAANNMNPWYNFLV